MHISLLLMNQIIQLFIMIFMGFIIVKAKLLKAEDSKILSVTAKLTASQEVDQQALFSENYSPRIEGNVDCAKQQ